MPMFGKQIAALGLSSLLLFSGAVTAANAEETTPINTAGYTAAVEALAESGVVSGSATALQTGDGLRLAEEAGLLDLFRSALDDDSVDAVVISPMQSGQLSAAAESADKPIIALDTDFTSDKKLSFVGTGNEAAAKSGGLAAMKKAKSNGADKPQAVILTGAQGDETHEARLRGYRSAVEQAGGTVLEVQYCDAQPDRAAAAMEAVMQKYPQGVDALLVTSDDMALAAIKCIWDNNSAAYQKTVICGFDGNQAAVEALDRGELTVDIAQQGYEMGYKAVEAALDALEGKSVESVIDSGSEVITADNIDAYIADCREKGLWS